MIRTFAHQDVEELARYASVPVINGLTDLLHPCQILADLLTVRQHLGGYRGEDRRVDRRRQQHGELLDQRRLSASASSSRIACPEGYEPADHLLERARKEANIVLTRDPKEAIQGADVVNTDVWASMGQEGEQKKRERDFAGYTVDRGMMARAASDAIFLHCLPAHRGEEVTADVIDGPQSRVWDEAENRLHIQKAIMAVLMGGESLDMKRERRRVRQVLRPGSPSVPRSCTSCYDRLGVGGSLPLIACCAGLAVAGALVRWRDVVHAPADATFDVPRRALRATARLAAGVHRRSPCCACWSPARTPRAARSSPPCSRCCSAGASSSFFRSRGRPTIAAHAPSSVAHAPIAAGLVVATIAMLVVSTRLVDHWTSIDEVIYSLQAHLFLQGDYRWHLDEGVQRFFTLPLMVPTPAGPYSQYPPGYPGILAFFVALGAPSVSGAVLGAVAVASTYMLGRRCASPFVGVVAAALLATHFLFLEYASRYLSHVAAMAAHHLRRVAAPHAAFGESAAQRIVEAMLAGLFIGIAVTIRPVTAIALGLSLWLWLLSSRGWRATRDTTLLLALGVVIPCVVLLLYNDYTNGSPFRLGYSAAQGHLNDLGPGYAGRDALRCAWATRGLRGALRPRRRLSLRGAECALAADAGCDARLHHPATDRCGLCVSAAGARGHDRCVL